MEELKIKIQKKIEYLESLRTNDSSVSGQLIGLYWVVSEINKKLIEEKHKTRVLTNEKK